MRQKFESNVSLKPQIKTRKTLLNAFFNVHVDTLYLQKKEYEYDYYSLEARASAVVVIAKTPENLFVINEEYRHPVGEFLLSCPGGSLDADETPETGAARELAEETGFTASSFVILGSTYPYPAISSQKLYYVAACNAKKEHNPTPDAAEIIQTHLMSIEEINSKISQGHLVDGILCTALFLFQTQLASL